MCLRIASRREKLFDIGGCEVKTVFSENGAPVLGVFGISVRPRSPARGSCIASRLLGLLLCKYYSLTLNHRIRIVDLIMLIRGSLVPY